MLSSAAECGQWLHWDNVRSKNKWAFKIQATAQYIMSTHMICGYSLCQKKIKYSCSKLLLCNQFQKFNRTSAFDFEMPENINSNWNSIIQVINNKQQSLITNLVKSMHWFEILILIINQFNEISKSLAQIKQIRSKK